MSFSDFRGIWWVKGDPPPNGEDPGDRIAIGGTADRVTIVCIDDASPGHGFGEATYQMNPERIEVKDEDGNDLYWIRLTRVITCTPIGPAGPGSWTAEDNPGGDYGPRGK